MYVTDMGRTKGHVSSVTGVQWHPLEKEIILSAAQDGSIRIWNLRRGKLSFDKKLTCTSVYKMKNKAGQRTPATSLAYHPGGREFAVGTGCGSVQIWNSTTVRLRPERAVYQAHGPIKNVDSSGDNSNSKSVSSPAVTSVVFSPDGTMIASRAGGSEELDDTIRIWNATHLGKDTAGAPSSSPMFICPDVPSFSDRANCAFSPNSRILCVGTYMNRRAKNKQGDGVLRIYRIPRYNNKEQEHDIGGGTVLSAILQLPVCPGSSLIRVLWHPKLNQIVCGSADGR
jgi:hypothetical protein